MVSLLANHLHHRAPRIYIVCTLMWVSTPKNSVGVDPVADRVEPAAPVASSALIDDSIFLNEA